jgi:hypothetical protein
VPPFQLRGVVESDPAAADLALGAQRVVAGAALSVLRDLGVIVTSQGIGSFVAEK